MSIKSKNNYGVGWWGSLIDMKQQKGNMTMAWKIRLEHSIPCDRIQRPKRLVAFIVIIDKDFFHFQRFVLDKHEHTTPQRPNSILPITVISGKHGKWIRRAHIIPFDSSRAFHTRYMYFSFPTTNVSCGSHYMSWLHFKFLTVPVHV